MDYRIVKRFNEKLMVLTLNVHYKMLICDYVGQSVGWSVSNEFQVVLLYCISAI